MKKKVLHIIILIIGFSLFSCKKNCIHCHHIKVHENDEVGKFEIIDIQEACGRIERRRYTKQKTEGTDSKGKYNTFWECGLYEENFE